MPLWYYEKKDLRNTPSFRDGIDFEVERRYRSEGSRFIMQIGATLSLGHNTVATGIVYYHRFYMIHSFRTCPRYVTASCCLFLAGKVEETPKKCKDIIKIAKSILSEEKFQSFGDDPKEEIMTLERILLQTIKFDLQVDHPYNFLVKYAKCLKGDNNKLQKIVQMAWNFVNDSLSTTLCLQWEPEIIAVALIYLACKLSKFNVVDWVGRTKEHSKWWDMFVKDITMDVLEDICHQVLDLYQKMETQKSPPESPPQNPPSRAVTPTPKRIKTTSSTPAPLPVPAVNPNQQPPVSAAVAKTITPVKLPPPAGNSIPVKVSNNERSEPPEPPLPPVPHKMPKMSSNNMHSSYPSYPSTSYGHSSNYGPISQPPPPPVPLPPGSPPSHWSQGPPPPPHQPMSNSHLHNSGYSRAPPNIPPPPSHPSGPYSAPPPVSSYHTQSHPSHSHQLPPHPPMHSHPNQQGHQPNLQSHQGHPRDQGPYQRDQRGDLGHHQSNYYPPQQSNYYPNSHHSRNRNYHYNKH